MADVWSDIEIELVVADYFAMLCDELSGRSYSKAGRNRALQERLARSRGAIEFKHQNISAVLLGLGEPWIDGYKPAANFQNRLVDKVVAWLDAHPDWLVPQLEARRTSLGSAEDFWIGPPPAQRNAPPPIDPLFLAAFSRTFDAAERDARNRRLGEAGEELVFRHERDVLRKAGRSDLADRVRWTAREDGDGLGYDIASFEPDGHPRMIEVKTTNGWERTPFHISRNELAVAEAHSRQWHLVRLWNFARAPRAFALRPPLEAQVELTATSFIAGLR